MSSKVMHILQAFFNAVRDFRAIFMQQLTRFLTGRCHGPCVIAEFILFHCLFAFFCFTVYLLQFSWAALESLES